MEYPGQSACYCRCVACGQWRNQFISSLKRIFHHDLLQGTAIIQGEKGTSTTVLHGNASGAPTYGPMATDDIADNAVTTAKIKPGSNSQVLVTDDSGTVAWTDKNAFGAVADHTTIAGDGTVTTPFVIKDLGVSTGKLANNAVTNGKLAADAVQYWKYSRWSGTNQ